MINEETLCKLAKELSSNNIIWGIGGSYLLQLNNLYSSPNDLDLWINENDIKKVRDIFSNFEEIDTKIPLPKEQHFKMQYYDLEVDFVACFITKPNQHKFEYHIPPASIKYVKIGDMNIPCTLLEDWYVVYKLLGRDSKAEIIKKVFLEKEKSFSQKTINSLLNRGNKIPKRILNDVLELKTKTNQYSIYDVKLDVNE